MLVSAKITEKYFYKLCQTNQFTNVNCICCDWCVPQQRAQQYVSTDYDFSFFVVSALLSTKTCETNDVHPVQLFICNVCKASLSKSTDINACIPIYAHNPIARSGAQFLKALQEKPEYICTYCHHLLFRRSVVCFHVADFCMTNSIVNICLSHHQNTILDSTDGEYICICCKNSLCAKNPRMPDQACANGLSLYVIPQDLHALFPLERRLISLCIPFITVIL